MTDRHPFIGANLKHYRESKGLSMRDLGELSGVTYTAIGRYEREESELPYENAVKLASALGIPVQLLWDHIPAVPTPTAPIS